MTSDINRTKKMLQMLRKDYAPMACIAQQLIEDAHKHLYETLFDNLIIDEQRKTRQVASFDEARMLAELAIAELDKFDQDPEAAIRAYRILAA